jgi:YfiH family protein
MHEAVVLRSERLAEAGFLHGFSTRRGGASTGPYDSLNLGRNVGDEPEHVEQNHRRLADAIGYDPARLFDASQVHGQTVLPLRGDERPEEVRGLKADALLAREPGVAVAVRTADCVPVLIADPTTGAVVAVHAGWRGVVSGVVREAVGALDSRDPRRLIAAVGPSIGPSCFEVGEDVATALAQVAGDGIVIRRGPAKPHVDLWRAVEHQLRELGVKSIDTLGACTVCEPERFFSHRRDGPASGRMLSVVVAKAHQPG